MTPDEHPRRHHLADGPLSSLYAPSPSLSSFGAASVMTCRSARPASSSGPCVLPEDRISRNIIYIRRFCDHINVLHIFDQTCIVWKSGWSSTMGPPHRWYSSPLRLTPRRHRQADGQLSPLYPPSPSFSSFAAACVKHCGLAPPSLVRNIRLCCSSSVKCRKYKISFDVNMNIISSITFADTMDALTATFAV